MIDVLMSAWNGERFLAESIASVLRQTVSDLVFYIIDDASSDKTAAVIKGFSDKRIIFFQNKKQRGLTKNLNFLLTKCRGRYVARQDADDVSSPDRFEKQIAFLEKGAFDLIGCDADVINEKNKKIGMREYKENNLKKDLLKENIFIHSSWFGKKSFFKDIGGYDEKYIYAQDYELLLRAVDRYKLGILSEKLLKIRSIPESVSWKHLKEQHWFGLLARRSAFKRGTYTLIEAKSMIKPFISYLLPVFVNKFVYKNAYGYKA